MERQPRNPEQELWMYALDGQDLAYWRDRLTVLRNGTDLSADPVNSRYGQTRLDCVPFALAYGYVVYGTQERVSDTEAALQFSLDLAMYDWPDVAASITDYWEHVPILLQDKLGGLDYVRGLTYE